VHLPTHAYCYKEINFLKLSIKILHFRNFVQINYSTLGIAGKWWHLISKVMDYKNKDKLFDSNSQELSVISLLHQQRGYFLLHLFDIIFISNSI